MLIGVHHIPPRKVDQRSNIADTGFKIQEHRSHRRSNSRGFISDRDIAGEVPNRSNRSLCSHDTSKEASNQENHDSYMRNDSTKHLIKDIRESSYSHSNFEFADLLEDEDDCSYLEGSDHYNEHYARKLQAYQQHPKFEDVERKKEQTIEQIYWPFHRFYDINGHRRMESKNCSSDQNTSDIIKAWKIPEFVAPLSDRKDGGLMMDTSHLIMPMVFNGKQGKMAYEGKIYYMGIIDILQQYNVRKRAETRYRKVEGRGKGKPSCVSPDDYAERFISFFDQYSQKAHPKTYGEEESTEIEVTKNDTTNIFVTNSNRNLPLATNESSLTSNGTVSSAKGTGAKS
jgi:1-phosphatidylinositol-4-phosphate 5-kinase